VSQSLKGRAVRPSQPCKPETADKIKQTWVNKLLEADFDNLSYDTKRRRIIIEQDNKCNHCGASEWYGHVLTLEVDHINGINDDNRRENLEAICPNCHSVTDTWRGRNKPRTNGEKKVSDDELIEALGKHSNIRQALLSVGLAAKGNNYDRAKKLLS
jgi:5-methylcytosine-specific restriction endonuclease McrA